MKMLKLTSLKGKTFYMNPLQVLTVCDDSDREKGTRIYAGTEDKDEWWVAKESAHEVAWMWGDATKD